MTDQVAYIIKGNSSNERLWGVNSLVRDNVVFTISAYITILHPFHILNRLGNETPILESIHSSVIMEPPRMYIVFMLSLD